MKVKLVFKYDGSKFSGFQRLNNERSVQKTLEDALTNILGEEIEIKGAGRTDAGVHANGQVASFETKEKINKLKSKLNVLLMPDIVIKSVSKVNDDFHARHSAIKKEYIYKISLGPYKVSQNNYLYQPHFKIDISLMKEASKYLIGTHDYRNFISGKRENYETTIYSINFLKIGSTLEIRFVGKAFYRYMIRGIVGALLEVGKCKVSFSKIEQMINNPLSEEKLPVAPACGLYLNKIWY